MRVLVVTLDEANASIRKFARVDVTTDPLLGCRIERSMSACYDPRKSRLGPFEGTRLRSAIWNPQPADILVAASPDETCVLPTELTGSLPWILVLVAWCRLTAVSPSCLLDLCWHRGAGRFSNAVEVGKSDLEARFLARLLVTMLHLASPEELVAHSSSGCG